MRRLLAVVAFTLMAAAVVGCGPAEEVATEPAASEEAAPAEVEYPSRADEVARDEYSKPQEVYDFVGVQEGFLVADLLAGGGYNTYLLAERVGPEGRVYAQGETPTLVARLEQGDLAAFGNIEIVNQIADLPEGGLDAVLAVRAYHLWPDVPGELANLYRALRPGGVVGVVEVRLDQPRGHDMTSHRVGEETVIEDFTSAGFEYVGSSDILRREDDDYTAYNPGGLGRHRTDRMLLTFRKP